MKQEHKYELVKYDDGNISLDVKVSREENTVWLSTEEIGLLFDRNRTAILRHINKIYKNEELFEGATCAKNAQVQTEGDRTVARVIKYYNLDMIVAVGYRVKSTKVESFKKWALDILKINQQNNALIAPIIKFECDDLCLDVKVSPEEETVWLTANQMALLFSRDEKTIRKHINNAFNEGEVDQNNTQKMRVPNTNQCVLFYNLNVIISVGYRVKSQRGVLFRKWATSILKQYLLNGYAIDKDRVIAYQSNILNLEADVIDIKKKLKDIEETIYGKNVEVFYEDEIIEPYAFIRKLFFLAKKEINIIDFYADSFVLSMLTGIKVKISIITSSASYLNKEVIPDNITIIHNDIIHDRFIFIDEKAYLIGDSLNSIGKKRFVITKLESITKEQLLEKK